MKVLAAVLLASLFYVAQAKNATLHVLSNYEQTHGALCLDGSPAGYYLSEGAGKSSTKWILHLGGGGWCNDTAACYRRSFTGLGSSRKWLKSAPLPGFLSDNATVNPDFYDWNSVYVMYCDGASFAGYVEKPDVYMDRQLHYRGRANLKATLDDLLNNHGMDKATDVILTGCSAGGLATYLHADAVGSYLPKTVKKYRAFPDAGYFIDTPNINNVPAFRNGAMHVFKMQNLSAGVNQDCLKNQMPGEMWKCFFAPYTYQYVKTPLFVLNSMYDTAQLRSIFKLPCLPPHCNGTYFEEFYDYGQLFLRQAMPVLTSAPTNGFYIDSCLIHCQTINSTSWSTFSIGGVSMREAFARWYNGEGTVNGTRLMDCEAPYNCDQSCPGMYGNKHPLLGEFMFP